jgi:hypothetical protein
VDPGGWILVGMDWRRRRYEKPNVRMRPGQMADPDVGGTGSEVTWSTERGGDTSCGKVAVGPRGGGFGPVSASTIARCNQRVCLPGRVWNVVTFEALSRLKRWVK